MGRLPCEFLTTPPPPLVLSLAVSRPLNEASAHLLGWIMFIGGTVSLAWVIRNFRRGHPLGTWGGRGRGPEMSYFGGGSFAAVLTLAGLALLIQHWAGAFTKLTSLLILVCVTVWFVLVLTLDKQNHPR